MLMHKKPNDPKRIYLDQNKWVDLSRSYYQKPLGIQFTDTLKQAKAAVEQNRVRFPLSRVHIMETIKNGNASQRREFAQVLVEFSQGWTIAPVKEIARCEYNIALASAFNKPVPIISPLVFGRGVEFACGQLAHLPILLDSLNEDVRKRGLEVLTAILSSPNEQLRKLVVDPYITDMKTRALHAEQIRNLVKGRHRAKRHQAYMARQVFDDLRDQLNDLHAALDQIGLNFLDFLDLGREGLTRFYEDVPTLDVMTKLKKQRNDDFNKTISDHDLNDLAFLSIAIPYCDIVVTERTWVALSKREKIDQKYKTVLLHDLRELEDYV